MSILLSKLLKVPKTGTHWHGLARTGTYWHLLTFSDPYQQPNNTKRQNSQSVFTKKTAKLKSAHATST